MTPIRDRYANLVQAALRLNAEQKRRVVAALSAARPILERKTP